MWPDVEIRIKPKYLQNIHFSIFLFIVIISFGIYGILSPRNPWDIRLAASLGSFIFLIIFFIYLNHFYKNCVFLTMTPEKLIGYNHFNQYKGEIIWNDIVEMYSTGGTYYIVIKDLHGKELKTGAPLADFKSIIYKDETGHEIVEHTDFHNYEIVINEIIHRSFNCKRIDFRTIKNKFPRINIYEKGL